MIIIITITIYSVYIIRILLFIIVYIYILFIIPINSKYILHKKKYSIIYVTSYNNKIYILLDVDR